MNALITARKLTVALAVSAAIASAAVAQPPGQPGQAKKKSGTPGTKKLLIMPPDDGGAPLPGPAFFDRSTGMAGEFDHEGLRITGIEPRGYAERAGLEVGDVLIQINGYPQIGPDDFYRSLRFNSSARLLVRNIRTGRREYHRAYLPVSGVGPHPVPGDLSGTWHSNLGRVELRQDGYRVTGHVHLHSGRIATLHGDIAGSRFNFDWHADEDNWGSGSLRVESGHRLAGTYRNHTNGFGWTWTLRR